MKIRVVIAEDQAMVRGALAALLATEGDFEIAGQAQNGREALDLRWPSCRRTSCSRISKCPN